MIVLTGLGYSSSRLATDALGHITGRSLPQVEEVTQLKARTAKLDAAVMRSLAYEAVGMKAKRIAELDKGIGTELDALARQIAERKTSVDPAFRSHYEAIETALIEPLTDDPDALKAIRQVIALTL